MSLPSFAVADERDPVDITVNPKDSIIVCLPHDRFHFAGNCVLPVEAETIDLYVDSYRQGELSAIGNLGNYAFDWSPPGPGEYRLAVKIMMNTGETNVIDRVRFKAFKTDPMPFATFPLTSVGSVPLSVNWDPKCDFEPLVVSYYTSGQLIGSSSNAPYTVPWDLSGKRRGRTRRPSARRESMEADTTAARSR